MGDGIAIIYLLCLYSGLLYAYRTFPTLRIHVFVLGLHTYSLVSAMLSNLRSRCGMICAANSIACSDSQQGQAPQYKAGGNPKLIGTITCRAKTRVDICSTHNLLYSAPQLQLYRHTAPVHPDPATVLKQSPSGVAY